MILNNRPVGVSCGNAVWHAPQARPVCRAKLGSDAAGRGANDIIAITISAAARAASVNAAVILDFDSMSPLPLRARFWSRAFQEPAPTKAHR
jgi:hypothetical protein